MITENERNELGDVASVNSDNSVVQIAQKEDNKSRYKFKLREIELQVQDKLIVLDNLRRTGVPDEF